MSNNSQRHTTSPRGSSVGGGRSRGSRGGGRLSQLPEDARRRLGHGVVGSGSRTGRADPMADMHGVLQHIRSLQDLHMEGGDNEDQVDSHEVDRIETLHGSNVPDAHGSHGMGHGGVEEESSYQSTVPPKKSYQGTIHPVGLSRRDPTHEALSGHHPPRRGYQGTIPPKKDYLGTTHVDGLSGPTVEEQIVPLTSNITEA
ncbi:hypothetical protein L1887_24447 [Cichorium endivia]|nr:hypothetical protein L1887_24447 [Cichorium endivia]